MNSAAGRRPTSGPRVRRRLAKRVVVVELIHAPRIRRIVMKAKTRTNVIRHGYSPGPLLEQLTIIAIVLGLMAVLALPLIRSCRDDGKPAVRKATGTEIGGKSAAPKQP